MSKHPFEIHARKAAGDLVLICHGQASRAGWWNDPKTGKPVSRPVPEMLMLCVSELAEAMEADRKDLMDDKVPARKGLEVELADCVIRIFDMASGLGLDLPGAIVDKLAYNAERSDHRPENRVKAGGKKY